MILQLTDLTGRNGEIRTHDPLHPMQVRYQAALRPEILMPESKPRQL